MEVFRQVVAAFGRRGVPKGMEDRVPPGQYVTPKMPVMSMWPTPHIDLDAWRLRLFGDVERETELTWAEWESLAQIKVTADFHCVTQWSRLNVGWEGVPASRVLDLAQPEGVRAVRDAALLRRLHGEHRRRGAALAGRVVRAPARTARRWSRSTAGPCGWSCRRATGGRARSG